MRKVLYIMFAIVLTLSLNLMMFTPAMANDIPSSTMHFEGDLVDEGSGVYTGTIPMTAGEYYVPGGDGAGISEDGGFDVYAKTGGVAYVQGYYGTGEWNYDGQTDTFVIDFYGDEHDAYPDEQGGGPWGTWYNPDCADWGQYSLELTTDHWYLRYTPTGESPMSGVMYWYGDGTGYAAETDLGTQDGGHDGSAAHGGGAQAWDWDCGWGVEVIPLESPGFYVEVNPAESYEVTLTPSSATLIVEKQTEPDGAADSFTFTGDAVGIISDGQQIVVSGLQPGTYTSTETVPTGWHLDSIVCDDGNSSGDLDTKTVTFLLEAGETVKATFYNILLDYGDAPDSYGTLFASDGARHKYVIGHLLGTIPPDLELDGQPSPQADGDDLNPPGVPDDEDGVTNLGPLTPGDPAATVTVDGGLSGGQLDAWIDFNGNGAFDHPSEHLWGGSSITLPISAPPQTLTFSVPSGAAPGSTYARFRLSINGGLSPKALAPDGEVEDYTVEIEELPVKPPSEEHGAPVGIEVYSVNKPALLAPWIALAFVIIAGGIILVRRHKAHS